MQRWSGSGIRLSEVTDALTALRHQAPEDKAATRTAVMTLVVVASTEEECQGALGALRSLGSHHPARIILLRPEPDAPANIDAEATLYRSEAESHAVYFEEMTLRVGGQAARHLDSIVDTFTLADLPVVAWFPGHLPDPFEPLLQIAGHVVVDTRAAGSTTSYRSALELARRRSVIDLSWVRLAPWRELMAGLFDPPTNRPFISDIKAVTVKGKEGPRHLLGGWLMSQLDLRAREVQLVDARHVEITVTAKNGDDEGTFQVQREEGRRVVSATATISDGPTQRQILPLPDDSLSSSLSSALTHLQADGVWERAVSAAGSLPT
jgi:glucose-6-phosphate dehydrogenase assembly protein OpcA